MKVKVYDINAKEVGEINLPVSVFGAKISDEIIAKSLRVYLSNQRKSQASTKNRSQVAGTTKKMWAQKGTGRARHGSAKAPIFVGGGVAHGPSGNQNYTIKMNKKVKALALKSVLSKFAKDNVIIAIDNINKIEPKTKEADRLLNSLKENVKDMEKSKNVALVTTKTLTNVKRAFRNLPSVNLLSLQSLNTYDLSRQNFLIFSKKALQELGK
ncbi:MAG: 50S ribosomal protein L4 [Patescibacteria group bacterium]|jgi:large subunit ribosomal protein L4